MSCPHCIKAQQLTGRKFTKCRPCHKLSIKKVLKRVERKAEKAKKPNGR